MSPLIAVLVVLLVFVIVCWIISIIPFPPPDAPPSKWAPYVKPLLYIIAAVFTIAYLLRYLPK